MGIKSATQETGLGAKTLEALHNFDRLPDSASVRLPVVAAWLGCSPATVWRRVKDGTIPAPKKFGPKLSAWNVGQLRASRVHP